MSSLEKDIWEEKLNSRETFNISINEIMVKNIFQKRIQILVGL